MSRKKTYLKYYKIEPCEENGKIKSKVVYIGDYYLLDMSPTTIRKMRIELSIYFSLINTFLMATLLINSSSSYLSYVVLPQIVSLAMGIIGGILIFPFLRGRFKYDIKQRNDALIAPNSYYIAKSILLALTIVARIVFIIVKLGEYNVVVESIFLVGCVLSFVLALRECSLVKGIKFVVEEKPTSIDNQNLEAEDKLMSQDSQSLEIEDE